MKTEEMPEARTAEAQKSAEVTLPLTLNQSAQSMVVGLSYRSCLICGAPLALSYGLTLCRICQCGSGG